VKGGVNFQVPLDHFWRKSHFLGKWGSFKNWFESETKPPWTNLTEIRLLSSLTNYFIYFRRAEFSKWWLNEFKTVRFPPNGNVFDFYVDTQVNITPLLYKCRFSLWFCSVSVIYCKSVSVSYGEKRYYWVLTVKTAILLLKHMYQPSLKIYISLTLTNHVKGFQ